MRKVISVFTLFGFIVILLLGCSSQIQVYKENYERFERKNTSEAYLVFMDHRPIEVPEYYIKAKGKAIGLFSRYNIKSLELRPVLITCSYPVEHVGYSDCRELGRGNANRDDITSLLISELRDKGYSVRIGDPIYLHYFTEFRGLLVDIYSQAKQTSGLSPAKQKVRLPPDIGFYGDIKPLLKIVTSDVDAILTYTIRRHNAQDDGFKGETGPVLDHIELEYNIYAIDTKNRIMSGRSEVTRRATQIYHKPNYKLRSITRVVERKYTESEEAYMSRLVREDLLKDLPSVTERVK